MLFISSDWSLKLLPAQLTRTHSFTDQGSLLPELSKEDLGCFGGFGENSLLPGVASETVLWLNTGQHSLFIYFFHWHYHIMFIFQFVNMVYHTDWLHRLKNPCIPGINPIWSWCMIPLMCRWILFVSILLRIFASMFISDIGL